MEARRLRAWYERTAKTYGKRPVIDPRSELAGFRRLAEVKAGESVLDVGTGTGRYLIPLARRGARCWGIDFSPAMLRELRKSMRGKSWRRNVVALRVGDARRLPFPAQRFDWVVCMGVLEYYPLAERRRILRELWRVLRPAGKAIIDMPDGNQIARCFQRAEQGVGNAVYLYERSTLQRLLRAARFAVLREQRAGMERQFLLALAPQQRRAALWLNAAMGAHGFLKLRGNWEAMPRDLDVVLAHEGVVATVRGNWAGNFLGRLTYVPDDNGPLRIEGGAYRKIVYPEYVGRGRRERVVDLPAEEMEMFAPEEVRVMYQPEAALRRVLGAGDAFAERIASALESNGVPVSSQGLTGSGCIPGLRRPESDFDWVVYGREHIGAARAAVESFGSLSEAEKMPISSPLFERKYADLMGMNPQDVWRAIRKQWMYIRVGAERASIHFVDSDVPEVRAIRTGEAFGGMVRVTDNSLSLLSPRWYGVEGGGIEGLVSWLFFPRHIFDVGDRIYVRGKKCLINGRPGVEIGSRGDRVGFV